MKTFIIDKPSVLLVTHDTETGEYKIVVKDSSSGVYKMKIGDMVKTKDNKTGAIVEILSRYVLVKIDNINPPQVYIKREIMEDCKNG